MFFRFFCFFFGFFLGFFSLFRCFGCFASIPKQRVSIDPKQTEDPPKQFKREYIWVFFRKFRVVSVCFGLLRNKPKLFVFGFTKQTETNAKQILFQFVRFEPKIIFVCFEDTLPSLLVRKSEYGQWINRSLGHLIKPALSFDYNFSGHQITNNGSIHIFLNFLLLDNLVFLMIELERLKMVDGSI
jgi:hypothetical protein